ncbi:MAG: DUF4276 family protein [Cyclobacteriaceae bacterium]|nr:DUF4276 family protein [Cyclobacteriaceae bacterium]
MIYINIVFEDVVSEFLMYAVLESFENKFHVVNSYHGNGYGYIKKNIDGFNQASAAIPFFVLTDLDNYICPTALMTDWFKNPMHQNLIFRIAIREVESWILADYHAFAQFTGLSEQIIPKNPDNLRDPKKTIIDLIKRCKKRELREDIIPINNNASIGPNYNERLIDYILNFWNLHVARRNSESLNRTCLNLEKFVFEIPK